MSNNNTQELAFYVVQNNEGKFFRRKGYGGSGETWVDDFSKARVWSKISGARVTVGFFANHYPKYPPPKIIKLTVSATEVIDETDRINAAKEKKRKREEKRAVLEAERQLKVAKEELDRAKERYEKQLKGKR
jgi:hypothetical protein